MRVLLSFFGGLASLPKERGQAFRIYSSGHGFSFEGLFHGEAFLMEELGHPFVYFFDGGVRKDGSGLLIQDEVLSYGYPSFLATTFWVESLTDYYLQASEESGFYGLSFFLAKHVKDPSGGLRNGSGMEGRVYR